MEGLYYSAGYWKKEPFPGKEEDVLKLNAYNAWWESNFHRLLDAILMKKEEYNKRLKP